MVVCSSSSSSTIDHQQLSCSAATLFSLETVEVSKQPERSQAGREAVGYIPGALAQMSLAFAKGIMGSLLLTCCCLQVSLQLPQLLL